MIGDVVVSESEYCLQPVPLWWSKVEVTLRIRVVGKDFVKIATEVVEVSNIEKRPHQGEENAEGHFTSFVETNE